MTRNKDPLVTVSRTMSLLLRHKPEQAGLTLDAHGWVAVSDLLAGLRRLGHDVDEPLVRQVVRDNDKQRFAISNDGERIRANQGHSVPVTFDLDPREPPEQLYHGTADHVADAIRAHGLKKGRRHHVHLSRDHDTAVRVGQRHGRPIVFRVRSGDLWRNGYVFYKTANDVWLTDHVPPAYLEILDRGGPTAT